MQRHDKSNYLRELGKILRTPKTQPDMESFLDDFFTPNEIKQFVERYRIGDRLLRGRPQRQVKSELGVSISKVSRVSYMLKNGLGGFQRIWTSLHQN